MHAQVLCSRSKVLILVHQGQIDVIVGEAHLKQTVETIAHILVCDGVFLDAGHVDLPRRDELIAALLLVRVLKLRVGHVCLAR